MMTFLNTLITTQTGVDLNIWIPFLWNKIEIYGPFVGNTIYNGILKSSPYYGYAFYCLVGTAAGLKVVEYGLNYKYFLKNTVESLPVVSQVAWGIHKVRTVFTKEVNVPTQQEYYPLFNEVLKKINIGLNTIGLDLSKPEALEKVVFKDRIQVRYKDRENILALKNEFNKLNDTILNLQLIENGVPQGKQAYYNDITRLSLLENLTPEIIGETTMGRAFFVPEDYVIPCNHKIKRIVYYGELYKVPVGGHFVSGFEVYFDVPTIYGKVGENMIIVYADWFKSQFENLAGILNDNPSIEFHIAHKVSGLGLRGQRSIIDAEKSFLYNPKTRETINMLDYLIQKGLHKNKQIQFKFDRQVDTLNKTLTTSLAFAGNDMNSIIYNQVAAHLDARDIKSLKIATDNGTKDFSFILNPLVMGAVTISGAVFKLAYILKGTPILQNLDAINAFIEFCPHINAAVPDIIVKAKIAALEKIAENSTSTAITTNPIKTVPGLNENVSTFMSNKNNILIGIGIAGFFFCSIYGLKYLGNANIVTDVTSAAQPSDYAQSLKKYLEIL